MAEPFLLFVLLVLALSNALFLSLIHHSSFPGEITGLGKFSLPLFSLSLHLSVSLSLSLSVSQSLKQNVASPYVPALSKTQTPNLYNPSLLF